MAQRAVPSRRPLARVRSETMRVCVRVAQGAEESLACAVLSIMQAMRRAAGRAVAVYGKVRLLFLTALVVVVLLIAQRGARSAPPVAREGHVVSPSATSLSGPWSVRVGETANVATPSPSSPQMGVPSNWFQQGLDVDGVVWFSRVVDVATPLSHGVLRFEGVDYAAEVYWDEREVGRHRGYFAPFTCELGPVLPGAHRLSVRVDSPRETKEAFSLNKTLVKGVLGHHDTRPGGAWSERGQDANTGGIWGDVSLAEGGAVEVDDIRVSTVSATPESALLRLRARMAPRGEAATVRYVVRDPTGTVAAEGTLAEIAPGDEGRTAEASLTIERPRLWWPRELGGQPLYELTVEVVSEQTTTTAIPFGIRTVVRDSRSRVVINGVPVFLRGVNYIGSLYLATLRDAEVRRDLDLMIAANVNAVRVHAHVTSPAFYREADRLGMLVWQDFPLQWGYEESDAFTREAVRQVGDMVTLLDRHPSIIFWSADNEAPWSSDWMKWKYPDYDPDQNRSLGAALANRLVADDPGRPSQGNAHPAEHAWSGWYEGTYRDFAKATAQPLVTEFGAQALPDLTTLRTIFRDQELWPISGANAKVWDYHNFQLHETRDIARVPLGQSIEELVANTQSYQSRLTQFAAENLRRQKWQPVAGIFQFMFVEHWPSVSWGVVDYLRKPKPGYAALARSFQPLLAVAHRRPRTSLLVVDVVDDRVGGPSGTTLRVVYQSVAVAKEVRRMDLPLSTRPSEVVRAGDAIPCPTKDVALRLSVVDDVGTVLSENTYAAGYFDQ